MTEQSELAFSPKPTLGDPVDGILLASYLTRCKRRDQSAAECAAALGWGEGEKGKRRVRNAAESNKLCVSGPGRPYVHASRLTRDEFEAICAGYTSQIKNMSDRLSSMRRAFYSGAWNQGEAK